MAGSPRHFNHFESFMRYRLVVVGSLFKKRFVLFVIWLFVWTPRFKSGPEPRIRDRSNTIVVGLSAYLLKFPIKRGIRPTSIENSARRIDPEENVTTPRTCTYIRPTGTVNSGLSIIRQSNNKSGVWKHYCVRHYCRTDVFNCQTIETRTNVFSKQWWMLCIVTVVKRRGRRTVIYARV